MTDTKLDVRVYPVDEPQGSTQAFTSVVIDDLVAISGIRVVDGDNGLFVSMPQAKENDGLYRDIAYPITGELRNEITTAVLNEHDRVASLAPELRGYDTPQKGTEDSKVPENISLDVRVYPRNHAKGRLQAAASVSIDGKVNIRRIRINRGRNGLYVAMPQQQDATNQFRDIAFPVNGELRKLINSAILDKYERGEKAAGKSLADGLRRGAKKAAGQSETRSAASNMRQSGQR